MPAATVHDVAAAVLSKTGRLSTMKLQKLVYYAQAWHLALAHRPLFPDEIQAWANGPVCPDLFVRHKARFVVSDWPEGEPGNLDAYADAIVTVVVAKYATMTGQQLSELSHSEEPWKAARGGLPDGAYCVHPIGQQAMAAYYGKKGKDELIGAFLDV